jgi:maltose alpha-D-glucosyltransferase/alpha-amylase
VKGPETAAVLAGRLIGRRGECLALLPRLLGRVRDTVKIRVHGDLHLAQVLIARDDVMIVDFEGEPGRSPDGRRAKDSPLRDVAVMLRSLDYVAEIAAHSVGQRFAEAARRAEAAAAEWRRLAEQRFLSAYDAGVQGCPVAVDDPGVRQALLRFHLLVRALYEIEYESTAHPEWLGIPIRGVLAILDLPEDPAS